MKGISWNSNDLKGIIKTSINDLFNASNFDVMCLQAIPKYAWWNYRFKAIKHNAGHGINYFVIVNRLMTYVEKSKLVNANHGRMTT